LKVQILAIFLEKQVFSSDCRNIIMVVRKLDEEDVYASQRNFV